MFRLLATVAVASLALASPALADKAADARHILATPTGRPAATLAWAKAYLDALVKPAPPPAPAGTAVSGQTALLNRLSTAKGGETFLLADGTYSGFADKKNVTISGGRGAVFKQPTFSRLFGVNFTGVAMVGPAGLADGKAVVTIASSSNVTFDRVLISGADRSGYGLFARAADNVNVSVLSPEITKVKFGVVIWGGSGWLFDKPLVHNIRSDGFQISNSRSVTIRAAKIFDFYPVSGDHPDAFQLINSNDHFTLTGSEVTCKCQGLFADGSGVQSNLTVTGNRFGGAYANAFRITNGTGIASGNVITKGEWGYVPIVKLSGIRSDGSNVSNGKAF